MKQKKTQLRKSLSAHQTNKRLNGGLLVDMDYDDAFSGGIVIDASDPFKIRVK